MSDQTEPLETDDIEIVVDEVDSSSEKSKKKKDEDGYEKSPFRSKKFVFALVALLTWKAIILVILIGEVGLLKTILAAIAMIASGAVETLYIGGQAALDRYVRIAHIQASLGNLVSGKPVGELPGPPSEEQDEVE